MQSIADTAGSSQPGTGAALNSQPADIAAGVITALQADDVDSYDVPCHTALADDSGGRYGARLATDGESATYWLSVGRPDAVLTIDLSHTRLVKAITFNWRYPARSVLALLSPTPSGPWQLGGSYEGSSPPSQLILSYDGVVARRVRVYMAGASNSTWPMFGINELTVESCSAPELTEIAARTLEYSKAATPLVRSVSPRRGSTAGGTALTITVDGLPGGASTSDVGVTIAGVACTVTGVSAVEVRCTTGSYGRTTRLSPGEGLVQLTIDGVGTAAADAAALYEYVDLWSRRTTWGGTGSIPGMETTGDSIWIQQGQRIVLDADVKVYMLIVQGALEFDRKNVNLDANYIFVFGGSFTVGTETEPFLQRAVITLHGSPSSQEIPVYGAKTLSCRFCTLDLHGQPLLGGRTHTKLARTAKAGSYELWLEEPVDWAPGSAIAVTSTHYNGTFETFSTPVTTAVDQGGYRLLLSTPLRYDHLGETKYVAGGHSFEFRANVALLSRNVIVQGDTLSTLDKHGAHIMLHSRHHDSILDRSQGESLTARIEDIEVRYSGQMGRLGRYSIHFHMIGSVKNSYVRRNSIHHTYNRAIAIHGVHYLRVQDNVAFETLGHTYFVEDGLETKNIITGNLAANTRELFVGLTSDATPSAYWLVNGDNYVARNIAAGGTHYGFWVRRPPSLHPLPPCTPSSLYPPSCSSSRVRDAVMRFPALLRPLSSSRSPRFVARPSLSRVRTRCVRRASLSSILPTVRLQAPCHSSNQPPTRCWDHLRLPVCAR